MRRQTLSYAAELTVSVLNCYQCLFIICNLFDTAASVKYRKLISYLFNREKQIK